MTRRFWVRRESMETTEKGIAIVSLCNARIKGGSRTKARRLSENFVVARARME